MDELDPLTSISTNQVILDWLRFGAKTRVKRQFLSTATIHQIEDIITRDLVLALEASVLAKKLVGKTVRGEKIEPATWLDYVKRDYWYVNLEKDRIMRWIARRWPIRYRKIVLKAEFSRYHVFPDATIAVPQLGQPVIFEQWGPTEITEEL